MIKNYNFPTHIRDIWLTANQIRRASGENISKREFKALVKLGVLQERKSYKKGQSIKLYKVAM